MLDAVRPFQQFAPDPVFYKRRKSARPEEVNLCQPVDQPDCKEKNVEKQNGMGNLGIVESWKKRKLGRAEDRKPWKIGKWKTEMEIHYSIMPAFQRFFLLKV